MKTVDSSKFQVSTTAGTTWITKSRPEKMIQETDNLEDLRFIGFICYICQIQYSMCCKMQSGILIRLRKIIKIRVKIRIRKINMKDKNVKNKNINICN